LGEGEKQSGIAFKAGEQPSVVPQPGDGPFDFPALAIALEHAPVLSRMAFPAPFTMRTDQLDAVFGESITERIAVRGMVVNQSRSVFTQNVIVEQRFNQSHFGRAGAVKVDSQRQARPSLSSINLLPLPRLVGPTHSPLFLPG